jgi:hypothetical protein
VARLPIKRKRTMGMTNSFELVSSNAGKQRAYAR